MVRRVFLPAVAVSMVATFLVGCEKPRGAAPASGPASQPATASRPTTASRATTATVPAAASRPVIPQPPVSTRPVTISKFPARTAPASQPAGGATEAIYQAALEWIDRAVPYVDKMVPAAEVVADRLVGGGMLYVGGNPGFGDEMEVRAGGFPCAQVWNGQRLATWDVIFVGKFRPIEPEAGVYAQLDGLLRSGRFNPAAVVCFASRNWPVFDRLLPFIDKRSWGDRLHILDTGAPDGGSLEDLCLDQLATTALGWAFCGEVIAAATRKGKTLATYASDWEPGGPAWDGTVRGRHLHPKCAVPPQPPGKVGREYLTVCKRQLEQFIAAGQAEKVRSAAGRLARCMGSGGVVYAIADGHIHPRGAFVPRELPHIRMMGRSWQWRAGEPMGPGDVLLYMSYLRYPKDAVNAALARKAQVVVVCTDEGPAADRVSHVGSCVTDWDTVVGLPEYPIRVLPSSGTLQTPQWYSLMAETLAATKASRTETTQTVGRGEAPAFVPRGSAPMPGDAGAPPQPTQLPAVRSWR